MNLAVSHLAWENRNIVDIFQDLKKNEINNIEGVLTKIYNWESFTEDKQKELKFMMDYHGIEMPSIQSLFFNTNISSFDDLTEILNHFSHLIKLSENLGFKIMVFGSPTIRKTNSEKTVGKLFKLIDNLLDKTGLTLCIEPNTKMYGGGYFFTVGEIVEFININNLKNVKTMIDTHNIISENQNPKDILKTFYDYISHIHISEMKLSPITNIEFHKELSKQLKIMNYSGIVTYELLPCVNLETEIKFFNNIYS